MPRVVTTALAAVVACVATAACGGGGGGGDARIGQPAPATTAAPGTSPATPEPGTAPTTTGQPTPAPAAGNLANARVRLTKVAELDQPVALAARAGDGNLYIAEKGGRVRVVTSSGAVDAREVLDISGDVSRGGEQGLLGLAFSPDGNRLYVNYTDTAGDTRVVEYAFSGGVADPGSRRELLFVDQPFANHNGGNLVFGPDGKLWIGLGDGGSQNDPRGNAQSLDRLLGKMLRIDPTPPPAPGAETAYSIPPGNPFAGRAGARPEIWALGLRNPWRYSFDRATGDLWIGDVGGSAREEIDFQPAASKGGENYGWPRLEGTRRNTGSPPPGAVPPIKDYARSGGNCSITGGYVYRGSRIPDLAGAYVYGDYCAGDVLALTQSGGRVTAERALGMNVASLSSFGEDGAGELYALSLEGPLFRIDPA